EAFAGRLSAEGTDLVVVARRGDRLRRLAAELRHAHGIDIEICQADLTDAAALAEVDERFDRSDAPLDLLVNNAGGGSYGPFLDRSSDGLVDDVLLNGVAVLRLTHAAVRHMVAN